jgi:hypothetical protein
VSRQRLPEVMHEREERSERMRWCGAAEERAAAVAGRQRLRWSSGCAGGGTAAWEEARRRETAKKTARVRWRRWMKKEKKEEQDVRLKRLRSAFHAMTGRAGRLTEGGGAASYQSPVSSWCD